MEKTSSKNSIIKPLSTLSVPCMKIQGGQRPPSADTHTHYTCAQGLTSAEPCVKVCLFVPSLFSCHKKATVALYFGRNRTRLGVFHFRVFRLLIWILTTEFAACSKPPSKDNHRKALFRRTQKRVRWVLELNLNHAIVITRLL